MDTATFWTKVDKTGDCWLWTGARIPEGYGQVVVAGRINGAHRRAYELTNGPVPQGMVLDHLCRVPACVNPAHLEPVTQRENILRGTGPSALNAAKTTCTRGHPLEGSNLRHRTDGARSCHRCAIDRQRVRRAALRVGL